jgi:hypothetical protein
MIQKFVLSYLGHDRHQHDKMQGSRLTRCVGFFLHADVITPTLADEASCRTRIFDELEADPHFLSPSSEPECAGRSGPLGFRTVFWMFELTVILALESEPAVQGSEVHAARCSEVP